MTWMVRVWHGAKDDEYPQDTFEREFHFLTREEAQIFKDVYNKKFPLEYGWVRGKYGMDWTKGAAVGPWEITPECYTVESATEDTMKHRKDFILDLCNWGDDCGDEECIYCKQEYRMEASQ